MKCPDPECGKEDCFCLFLAPKKTAMGTIYSDAQLAKMKNDAHKEGYRAGLEAAAKYISENSKTCYTAECWARSIQNLTKEKK